ncbi:MAG: TrkH family potassium uptake protein [Clostridiales bacterium]|nr:TrkH family potassium uptake protein [Clostridiales bacterium]
MGRIFIILALLLCLPLLVNAYYILNGFYEANPLSFVIPILLLLAVGNALTVKKPKNTDIYSKEGFVICGLAWILMSVFGALPFVISGAIPNYIDAFFETISGFTTTGSSILSEIESLPKSILFWRSFTHWIGGMGILTFMIAVVPRAKGNSMFIMRAEAPGPTLGKVVSKIGSSARILYIIYLAMTLLEILVLFVGTRITGENIRLFDCVVNALSNAGTGGFSVLNDSIKGYNSPFTEWVIIVFMFLYGVNFNLYYYLLIGKPSNVLRDEELRGYMISNLAGVLLITLNIYSMYSSLSTAVRDAFFNVNAVMSTTGFCTADFDKWPTFSKVILLILMCFGASAGSTGGGFKIVRIEFLVKQMIADFKQLVRPNAIVRVRMNGKTVEPRIVKEIKSYLNVYVILLVVSTLLISVDNFDTTTTFTSVVSCLNNIGPALSVTGPTGNYADFSVFSKFVLIFDMLAGRLELFPVLLLINPSTWRKAK